jgi:hypothetical protein
MKINELITETTWQDIYKLNRDVLSNPDKLRVGMELLMPDDSIYRIAPGDNLSKIAAGQGKGTRERRNTRTGMHEPVSSPGDTVQVRINKPVASEPVSRSGAARSIAGKVQSNTGDGPLDIGNGVLVDPNMKPSDIESLQTTKASAWPGEMWKVINGKFETVPVIAGKPIPWTAPESKDSKSADNTPAPQHHVPGAQHDGQQKYNYSWTDSGYNREKEIERIKRAAGVIN